jgi:hypothetical protein
MSLQQQSLAWAILLGLLFTTVELLGASLEAPYSVYQIVWMRYGVHLAIMLVVFGRRDLTLPFGTEFMPRQILRSLLMLAMAVSWGWAVAHGEDPMTLAAGLAATPALVALIVAMLGRARLGANTWSCAILSVAGGLALAWHHVAFRAADLLPIVAALCLALYVIETRQLRHEPLRVNLFHTACWVFLALTPVQRSAWISPPVHDWLVIVMIGAAGLLALLALDHMVRGAGFIAFTTFTNIPVFFSAGLVFLHAPAIPPRSVMAALLLLAAAVALSCRNPVSSITSEMVS